ncbi:hypothetical protein C8F04DRAFT_1233415 [Mycena alexandri]|uniref:Uncharacterized protein n=1 Tax=Mycena alexandri TaxID=1745969 RepID=A0AAD6SYQ9_9AGAR|nr:hypothetical protein C8F04DRAFT_1233415 [Mycena alexandri]
MTLAITFVDRKLVDSSVIGPDGGVRYTTGSTDGSRGLKLTTIAATSGLVGSINWREELFVINGVEKKWDELKSQSGRKFGPQREWNWDNKPYTFKYQNCAKELLVTPNSSGDVGTVRFTTSDAGSLHENDNAVVYFPEEMQDDTERMFLLIAILQTEMHRQDMAKKTGINAAASL